MTELFREPFDNFLRWHNSGDTSAPPGGVSIVGGGRTGNGAQSGGTAIAEYTIFPALEDATLTFGFAFQVSTIAANRMICQTLTDAGSSIMNTVTVNTDGSLSVRRGTTSGIVLGTTATGLIAINTWHYVELQILLSATVGTVTLRLDGSSVLTLTGQNTKAGSTKTVYDTFRLGSATGGNNLYDDVYLKVGAGETFNGSITVSSPSTYEAVARHSVRVLIDSVHISAAGSTAVTFTATANGSLVPLFSAGASITFSASAHGVLALTAAGSATVTFSASAHGVLPLVGAASAIMHWRAYARFFIALKNWGSWPVPGPPPPPPPPPPVPVGGTSIGSVVGGVSMPLEQVQGSVTDAFLDAQADALVALGAGWQRGDYPAYLTEATEGTFTYTSADRWVTRALSRGLKPLPILYMLPSWMNGSGNDKTPPLDDADYATWCATVCTHLWGLGVRHVELWNEQNLAGFWNAPHTDSGFRVKYVSMAIAATVAIKAATPGMTVISGGVSTSDTIWDALGTPNPPGKGALSTLQRYGELGLFEHVDAVGWHPYIEDDGVCEDHGGWPTWGIQGVQAALDVIDAYAAGRTLTLWTTESGCSRWFVGGSESAQATRAHDAYAAYMPGGCMHAVRSRLGPFFWFTVADRITGNSREDTFGLMNNSLTTAHAAYIVLGDYFGLDWNAP